MIPLLSRDNINNCSFEDQYYWSNDFSPSFYIDLAQRGLISTSMPTDEIGDVLLPEMQESYAVLDFDKLHIGKKVKKLFSKDHKLTISKEPDIFIPLLLQHHGDECWFTDEYIKLVYKLFNSTLEQDNFRLNTVFLYSGETVVAGEIGYFIGSTYTSLTGFFNRDFSNWGTFQLILLAKELESMGIEFWNLGHPYMEYKFKIGATVLRRSDFLKRWQSSSIKTFQQV